MFSRKLLILYIVLLSAVLVTMGILFYLQSVKTVHRDYQEIRKEGILRIVTEYDLSGYFISENKIEGFQYELSKEIAELSGMEVLIYLEMSLEKSFEGLLANKYDVVARNIPTTSELKEYYAFTEPIVLNRQVLVQRSRANNNGIAPLRNHLELAGKTLYIPEASPVMQRLLNLQHEIGDTIHIVEKSLYSSEQLIIMVAKGDIDFTVSDLHTAQTAQKLYPEIDINTDISFSQLQSWALRKDSPTLLDSLNHWINILRETGQFDRIYQEYYTPVSEK
ncbi:MAG: transporter substrate-binding domain-containing protein [Tannerella sp.]|jgi:membrane-bound lytic murein transglycosylase MltF|nr:transporter substrate-binding domain-containing protein [Tannerella sp.]